jgi:hypothetical protein
MEHFFEKDSSFELQSDLDGMELLNNRTLTTMPSERSSFQVDLGFDGHSNFIPIDEPYLTDEQIEKLKKEAKAKELATDDAKAKKITVDPEKLAQGITAGASALGSVVGTVQAFKGDGTKAPSRRKQLKEVCGRKPLLKKKRGEYDKCVANYNAGKIGGVIDTTQQDTNTQTDDTPPPPKDNKKIIIIGVVVVAVLVTAFIGYKKGWFGAKAK